MSFGTAREPTKGSVLCVHVEAGQQMGAALSVGGGGDWEQHGDVSGTVQLPAAGSTVCVDLPTPATTRTQKKQLT